jgi:hypothetical protein
VGVIGNLVNRGLQVTAVTAPGTMSSSTSVYKMTGCAVAYTPSVSNNILIIAVGLLSNDTGGDNALTQLAFGTGTAPVANAAAAGTQVGNIFSNGANGTTVQTAVWTAAVNMTLGTAYWIDLASKAVTGGNVIFGNVTFLIVEY